MSRYIHFTNVSVQSTHFRRLSSLAIAITGISPAKTTLQVLANSFGKGLDTYWPVATGV